MVQRQILVLGCVVALHAVLVWSCVPVSDTDDPNADLAIDFKEPEQRRLYDLQDRLEVDSLLQYLEAPQPMLRYLAARAFGSVQSDSAVGPLTKLLLDPVDDIRAAAAYALGQQGDSRAQGALLQAFDFRDTAGVYADANGAILEAIGKVGDTTMLRDLAAVSTYLPTDTSLALGQARGIYRFATRGLVLPSGTSTMIERVSNPSWPGSVRLVAAHYLQRADVDLTGFGDKLLQITSREADEGIRMALSRALGKTKDPAMAERLAERLRAEPHTLVRVELVRALGKHPYDEARAGLLAAVTSAEDFVAETAGEVLTQVGVPEDATLYWRIAKDTATNAAARYPLYAAALRHLPAYLQDYRGYINTELRRAYAETTRPYERAKILRALAEYPWNFRFLIEQALTHQGLVEATAAAEALDGIVGKEGSAEYFRSSFPAVKREYASYLQQVMEGSNVGQQAVAAGTLAYAPWNFQTAYENLDWLLDAKRRLKLPRDTETAYAIEDAQAQLQPDFEPQKPPPAFNHPINWDIYRSLQPGLEVAMETPHGTIVIDLLEREAPASVVNFVQTVRNGFYTGKRFHRIVPGFVTQGGGPRGDGYGSLDYTLRTETPPVYYDGAGYVGMASAGRHTEGVQFFFTHQATPHLDGRYTVFGRVTEGMDVVLALRQGDEMGVRLR